MVRFCSNYKDTKKIVLCEICFMLHDKMSFVAVVFI